MTEIITGINKESWVPAIRDSITKWKNFSESVFCTDPEDKRNALDTVNTLKECLSALESDTLTRKQFEEMRFWVW